MDNSQKTKELALLGVKPAEWWPTVCATAEGANRLTEAIVTMAYHALEEEREGSEIPALMIGGKLNLAYEAVLRERALYYLQSLRLEADASTLEILADIFDRQLYMHHPDQWGSLAEFLRNMAVGKSASYQSVVEGLVTVILPFLETSKLATVREMMELITEGAMSNLYHLKSEMAMAVANDDRDALVELLTDAKALGRRAIFDKYKKDRMRVPPAKATIKEVNPHWVLTITMTEAQKRVILNRLGNRIEREETEYDPDRYSHSD